MCGIAGVMGVGGADLAENAVKMALNQISHRGPDSTGFERLPGGAMGMCRLSIIDISHGSQPVYSECGRFSAVFNGEIYNYRELAARLRSRGHNLASDSDSEVIPHLFEDHGYSMFSLLEGMFAIAIHDRKTGSYVLARDRFGKKPLFYSELPGGGLTFASEIKAITPMVKAYGGRLSVADQSVSDFLSFGIVPQPRTIFSEVSCVDPASYLVVDHSGMRSERYWTPEFTPKSLMSFQEAAERTRTEIASATRKRLRADVPVGVFLSGGVDSSIVAYEAAKEASFGVETFTVKVNDDSLDESSVAARTASSLGLRNHTLHLDMNPVDLVPQLVDHYDQPYADASAIPSMEISKLASAHVKVVLNGDGGDEVFGGYRRHLAARQMGRLDRLPQLSKTLLAERSGVFSGASRRSMSGLISRFRRGLAMDTPERYLAWTTDMLRHSDSHLVWRGATVSPSEDLVERLDDTSLGQLDRQMKLDVQINLLSDLLVKMDMATMLHSIEGRSPFLDHNVADLAFRLPDSYKVRGRTTKAVLKHAYRGLIPDEVITAPKRGFEIPVAAWLAEDLRPMIMDTVMAQDSHIARYLDGEFVRDVFGGRALTDRNTTSIKFAFLVLEMWLRKHAGARADFR